MDAAGGALAGIFGIAVMVFAAVLGIFWLALPMVIYFKLSKIEAHLSDMNKRDANRYEQQKSNERTA